MIESQKSPNRIHAVFQGLRARNAKTVIPYVTPEFPLPGCTVPLILGLARAGAELVEVGIPFSDPIADGPTIQHSSHVALRNGATLRGVLDAVRRARAETEIPIIMMGYTNSIFHYGIDEFLRDARASGVDGVIIPDLLPEEAHEWRSSSLRYGMANIFLIAPTTSEERMREIDAASTEFTYCVSITGVTGARSSLGKSDAFESFLKRVKKNTAKPFVVGFGISTPEHVASVFRYADGAVVGSALLQKIENEKSINGVVNSAAVFFRSLLP